MLSLLLIGMLTLAFSIQPVKADWTWTETIYIRADGSVEPDTAPISSADNITYTLTDNIVGDVPEESSAIVVEKDNVVVDGAGYTLQGTQNGTGLDLTERNNVTIKNVEIKSLMFGIGLDYSSNCTVSGNNVTNNGHGICLRESSNNVISGNNITNYYDGIHLWLSSNYNTVSGNNITNNYEGIVLEGSSNNTVSGNSVTNNGHGILPVLYSNNNSITTNNVTNNYYGIWLFMSSINTLYHNNLIDNTRQVYDYSWDNPLFPPSINVWDDGYPSGGNYWSNHVTVDDCCGVNQDELGSDGIVDEPYVIDDYNCDNYPLVEPWTPLPPIPTTLSELKTKVEELGSEGEIDNRGIVKSLIAKLNVAQKLVDKGKIDEAIMVLEDFITQVQELSGIHITPEAADILIQSAEYILSHL